MRRLDSSTIKKIRSLRKQGKILEEIREETGVSLGAISKYCRHVKVDRARRMVSGDPVEQEFDAENRELAQEAHRIGLEDLIAQREHNIAKIKSENKIENKIAYNEPAFLRGLSHLANLDSALAKEVFDSATSRQEQLFNYCYSKYPTENLMIPLLTLINRDKISVKDIIEIVKMVRPAT